MEIKTCEHYVVNRVNELEDEVTNLKDLTIQYLATITDLSEKLEFVGKFLSIRVFNGSNGEQFYIDFNNPWKNINEADYNKFCEMFGLVEPEKEE